MSETQDKSSSASGELPLPADAKATIARLQAENATLRSELEQLRGFPAVAFEDDDDSTWEAEMAAGITYADGVSHDSARSSGRVLKQLTGLSGARGDAALINVKLLQSTTLMYDGAVGTPKTKPLTHDLCQQLVYQRAFLRG